MRLRGEKVGAKGAAGVLKGVLLHGLGPLSSSLIDAGTRLGGGGGSGGGEQAGASTLLVDAAKRWELLADEQGNQFRLSPSKAEALALEIAQEYLGESPRPKNGASTSTSSSTSSSATSTGTGTNSNSSSSSTASKAGTEAGAGAETGEDAAAQKARAKREKQKREKKKERSKRTHLVSSELLRVIFRTSGALTPMSQWASDKNMDFSTDAAVERQQRAVSGLQGALTVMRQWGLPWDLHTADVLMDECFGVGDEGGVRYVTQQMGERGLRARTSTLNCLLRCYAENGDCESAYQLVTEVMVPKQGQAQGQGQGVKTRELDKGAGAEAGTEA
ncbi:hypothetical protein B484DRAFT_426052, partial [Ochromonadaceae sp. CCMP2298]